MADQPTASTSSPASSPSVPPSSAVDPSPGVRITQHIREALTDTAGLVLAGYLVSKGAVSGTHALLFALALLLPSPLLLRLAKVLGARGSSAGAGVAVALLGASAAWAKVKGVAVLGAGVLGLAACLGGCAAASNPMLSPIAPRLIDRPEYGRCIETGGKLQVPDGPSFALITQACVMMDASAAPVDASDPEPEATPDKADAGASE